jgi:hypothetical protein
MSNNLMDMMMDVPPMLLAGWLAWFIAGGILAMWYRRAEVEAEFMPAPVPRPSPPRPRAVTRPELVVAEEPTVMASMPVVDEPAREKRGPLVVGDPFGDLASLIDQAAQNAPSSPSYRVPGDSPILNSAGSPVRGDER